MEFAIASKALVIDKPRQQTVRGVVFAEADQFYAAISQD
jgi:hypothetical protein